MSAQTNKEIIRKVNETFCNGDINGFLDHCTENITWKMIGQPSMIGKEVIRKAMAEMGQAPPEITIERIVAEDNTVMVEGEYKMKELSGKIHQSAFCDIYTLANDKICELRSYFNNASTSDKPAQN